MKTILKTFLILIFTASIGLCDISKVIDPVNPQFDPDKFSFSDYETREELIDAFYKLFPLGTPKEFVDRVLVHGGGAKAEQDKRAPRIWYYRTSTSTPDTDLSVYPQHHFIYDPDMKLQNIEAYGDTVLYKEQVTSEFLKLLR